MRAPTSSSLLAAVALALLAPACGGDAPSPDAGAVVVDAGRPFYDPNARPAPSGTPVEPPPAPPEPAPAPGAPEQDAPPGDPLARYGWTRDRDGYVVINFMDLALEGLDQELLVEKLLYPEDYEDVEIDWPERVRALDGQKVALTGYMIPILWKDTTVPEFMLVRDLLACCFGGTPKPDEWCSVKMQGEGAGYWAYVPVVTRGVFHLAGIADEAGYAAGGYSIDGVDVRREL